MSFFRELKQRNVLRVGTAYIVSSWLLIQVAETVFPLFGFDDTPARIVVIVLAIGFIPSLVLAWAFELLDRAVAQRDISLVGIFQMPYFAPVHDDPRWGRFLEQIGTSRADLDGIGFEVTLPQS